MSHDAVERIAFRFGSRELAALLKLMDLPSLPDTSVKALQPEEKTVQDLIAGGTVMVCGERVLVDRAVSLTMREAGRSKCRLALRGQNGTAVLYRGARICVLAEEKDGVLTLEPLPDMAGAWEPCQDAAARLEGPVHVSLVIKDSLSGEGDGQQALQSLFQQMKESEVR